MTTRTASADLEARRGACAAAIGLPQLISLLQLASPALPIGGFSYSQGLEAAIDHGFVNDAPSAERWIRDGLLHVHADAEAPLWLLLHRCWAARDYAGAAAWNAWFHASRETAELRLETEQMGWSLARLVAQMEWGEPELRAELARLTPVCLPTAFSAACVALAVPEREGLAAYCFSWAENQVVAALKAVPLGQVAGQRILHRLNDVVQEAITEAGRRANATLPELSTFSPMLGLLSARHEAQYSRLFRS
ncbi:MAG: urease accessory protein UreF [Aromatoleum sp.]|jgi:urease accessory protein|uniref:urease accessory protein UreF n=1 Tax=Aromatoleum sp. TaxID=2307007 RepID=UPI002894368C|nr:urease accessory protein UreF [Aromatoleum sp.]MDT3669437.1 urease accessory protein UreF [Aromatoleum sp.]